MASNHTKVNEQLGLSISGNYHHNDGFFTNLYTHKKADKLDNGAGRIGLIWKPAAHWTTRFITSYEYSNQGGYPYGLYNADNGTTEAVNYNDEGLYRRNLLTSGVNVRYDGSRISFNSQTSYQYIQDKMGIDQDFSPRNIFYGQNRIRQHMYCQEFTAKSVNNSRYHWITGLFAFRQTVDRKVDLSRFTDTTRHLTNSEIPTQGIAFYHQSTLDLFQGLSCSVGLRYDYEHARCDFSKVQQPLDGKEKQNLSDNSTDPFTSASLLPSSACNISHPTINCFTLPYPEDIKPEDLMFLSSTMTSISIHPNITGTTK